MQNPSQVSEAGVQWRNELLVLQEKRTHLAQLLETMTDRRGQLADQVARTEGPLRAAPQARLAELDARILATEKEAARTDDRITELLSKAPVEVRTAEPAPPPFEFSPATPTHVVEIPTGWNAKDVMELAVLEAGGFIVLTAILCRFAWLSAKRRFSGRVVVDNSQLQQSVDAIAIEVERISEGQRFVTTLLNQRHLDRDARPAIVPPGAPRVKTTTPV